ncbi:MAG: bacillithiol system redox-active protein YtxJ [Saprospiraceae bacterium]
MTWEYPKSQSEIENFLTYSGQSPIVLFKHSYTCSISQVAKSRMDTWIGKNTMRKALIDVREDRPLSQYIATRFNIQHESPQILVIYKDACVYNASHFEIKPSEIDAVTSQL